MTMHLAKLRLLLAALVAAPLALGLPSSAWAQDEDEDGDNVWESDEVSGDEEYEEEEGDDGTTTIVIKDTDPSAVVVFRDELAPYGSWMEHPTYGTIWVPSSALVGSDFAPYVSSGHWELTEEGDWLWVSDYEWGYVPFHYGRWVWVSGVGWGWIPGRVYAPAWVVWRTGESGYIGWAPMPPAYYWADGVAVTLWVTPPAAYVFCHSHHFWHHHVHDYVIHDHAEVHRAAQATTAYTPARPTKAHTPAHPTVKQAGVDAPKSYGKHDPKATRFMRPDGSAPKSTAANKAASRANAALRGKSGSGSAASRGSSAGARLRGSRSLGATDDGFVTKRSGRGSFTTGDPAPKSRGSRSLGSSRSNGDVSAPSRSDGSISRPSRSGRSGKSSPPSRSSSSDDGPSRSRPPSRSGSPSRSSAPHRDSPSFGGTRPRSPSISRPPSGGSAPSSKRAAPQQPPPVRKAPAHGPSRGRGRR